MIDNDPGTSRAVFYVLAGELLLSEILLTDVGAPVPGGLTDVVAENPGFDSTVGEAFWVGDVPIDTAGRADKPSEADTLTVVPPCLVGTEVGQSERPPLMVLLTVLPISTPASTSQIMFFNVVTIEAGIRRNSVITEDAT